MPRRAKGPRLYLEPARRDRGQPATWVIRDGSVKRSTGAGASETAKAENALRKYLNEKATPRQRDRDPAQVRIADVIAIYAEDVAPKHSRPEATAGRLNKLLDHFGDKPLTYLNKATCQEYVAARGSQSASRRELEDLRSAIRHHWELGLSTALVPIVLPDKSQPRERWLTRGEAAKLLWIAWRRRQKFMGTETRHASARHVARFILVGLYTGTRSSAICGAALAPEPGRGWVDLENGVFYRRAIGRRETNKRQPAIRIPPPLLAHMRRWKAKGYSRNSVIEFQGRSVLRISKTFERIVEAAGLRDGVSPHTLRHTAITWQAQLGVPAHEICGFFGITSQMFDRVYGHHHPDHQAAAVNALHNRRQKRDRNTVNETGQSPSNVIKIASKV
jgi:integrase